MNHVVKMLAIAALAAGLCCGCGDDDDGPGTTAEEECCSCVEQNDCADDGFSFGECVPDGYHGEVDLEIDHACVDEHCADECDGASFQ